MKKKKKMKSYCLSPVEQLMYPWRSDLNRDGSMGGGQYRDVNL